MRTPEREHYEPRGIGKRNDFCRPFKYGLTRAEVARWRAEIARIIQSRA